MFTKIRNWFTRKQQTAEHFPTYTCKGICHKDMRCIDLPNHAQICTQKGLILTEETIAFLKKEIAEVVDEAWKTKTEAMLAEHKIDPASSLRRTRTNCCI